MLCVSITASTTEGIFSSDLSFADCAEVRLDYLKDPMQSLEISWSKLRKPVIATCRRRDRGGRFDGSAQDERRILAAAAQNGAAYIEMDYRDVQDLPDATCIASYHDVNETPEDLSGLLANICSSPAPIAKLVTAAH